LAGRPGRIPIIVDTDIGVDDAAALAYLLNQPGANILGITAVAGNVDVENAANNALILLETANRTDIPVVIGAATPLAVPASHQGVLFMARTVCGDWVMRIRTT
jgi:inosine-uridine nucleoside N-ribohydrolase